MDQPEMIKTVQQLFLLKLVYNAGSYYDGHKDLHLHRIPASLSKKDLQVNRLPGGVLVIMEGITRESAQPMKRILGL